MPIKKIEGDDIENDLKNSEYPVSIIKYGATWCNPCSMATKMITQLDTEGKLKDVMVYEVDIESDRSVNYCSRAGIRGVPTFQKVDKDGNILDTKVGMGGPDQFLELCKA